MPSFFLPLLLPYILPCTSLICATMLQNHPGGWEERGAVGSKDNPNLTQFSKLLMQGEKMRRAKKQNRSKETLLNQRRTS